ncbi:hypothetical protein PMIN03_002081 [Paraphaeosphaeria minitans]
MAGNVRNPYTYTPLLAHAHSIRLMRLLPASRAEDPIHCRIFNYSLTTPKRTSHLYECLSYVWGSVEDKQTIQVDDAELAVTKNLDGALRRLRDPDLNRILWVDAVCINQVVLWLGEEADGSKEAMELLRKDAGRVYRKQREPQDLEGDHPDQESSYSDTNGDLLPGDKASKLVQDRTSSLQTAARVLVVLCGYDELTGACFFWGLSGLLERCQEAELRGTVTSILYLLGDASILRVNKPTDLEPFRLGICSLSQFVDMFRLREATDPRDKVPGGLRNHIGHTEIWNLHNSAAAVEKGDIVCWLEGSTGGTIIQFQSDSFIIVVAWARFSAAFEKDFFRQQQLSSHHLSHEQWMDEALRLAQYNRTFQSLEHVSFLACIAPVLEDVDSTEALQSLFEQRSYRLRREENTPADIVGLFRDRGKTLPNWGLYLNLKDHLRSVLSLELESVPPKDIEPDLVEVRHRLHANHELGTQVIKTWFDGLSFAHESDFRQLQRLAFLLDVWGQAITVAKMVEMVEIFRKDQSASGDDGDVLRSLAYESSRSYCAKNCWVSPHIEQSYEAAVDFLWRQYVLEAKDYVGTSLSGAFQLRRERMQEFVNEYRFWKACYDGNLATSGGGAAEGRRARPLLIICKDKMGSWCRVSATEAAVMNGHVECCKLLLDLLDESDQQNNGCIAHSVMNVYLSRGGHSPMASEISELLSTSPEDFEGSRILATTQDQRKERRLHTFSHLSQYHLAIPTATAVIIFFDPIQSPFGRDDEDKHKIFPYGTPAAHSLSPESDVQRPKIWQTGKIQPTLARHILASSTLQMSH